MRNHLCPWYERCLDRAARKNEPELECHACQHRARRVERTFSARDAVGCQALVIAALHPHVYTDTTPQNLIAKLTE